MYRQRYPDDPGMHNQAGERFTETSYRPNPSFFQRIKQSLVGVLIGLALIVGACGLLFWNEGRAVQTAQSLDEGMRVLVPLETIDVAFDNNEGRLVYLQGPLQTPQAVFDPVYKVSVHAAALRRSVQMYQWVEHTTTREIKEGDQTREETEYSYSTEWREDVVPSGSFHSTIGHENPSAMPVTSQTFTSDTVQIGAFYLSQGLIGQITDYRDITPSSGLGPEDQSLSYHRGYYFHSNNPSNPQVGDVRLKLEAAGLTQASALGPVTEVSAVAQQRGNRLVRYQTEAGDDLEMLHVGHITAKEIFLKAQAQNTMTTWGIRFGGWLLMFVAFSCLTSIITTLVDWLPIVRDLVTLGVAAMNAALSISLSLTVIALGWIRYRPWLGCTILLMSLAPFFLTRLRGLFSSASSSRHRNV